MDIFWTLFTSILPLYALIVIGFFAGKKLEVAQNSLANLALYIFLPVVMFGFVVQLDFRMEYVALPVLFFVLSAIAGISFYQIGRRAYPDARANLLGMCASGMNTGYFGLPIIVLLFEPEWVAVYLFTMIGGSVYEATISYYLAARGSFDARQSLIKIAKFPTIYALIAALIARQFGYQLDGSAYEYWGYFKGCYIVIGMMIIGVALSQTKRLVWAPKFFSLTFLAQFVLWPLGVFGLVWLDRMSGPIFAPEIHSFFMILSLLPPAANVVAFATQFNVRPDKAATTILFSTIFALFYIPAALVVLGLY